MLGRELARRMGMPHLETDALAHGLGGRLRNARRPYQPGRRAARSAAIQSLSDIARQDAAETVEGYACALPRAYEGRTRHGAA